MVNKEFIVCGMRFNKVEKKFWYEQFQSLANNGSGEHILFFGKCNIVTLKYMVNDERNTIQDFKKNLPINANKGFYVIFIPKQGNSFGMHYFKTKAKLLEHVITSVLIYV